MPTPPEGIPWLAWAIVVVALALIAQTPLLVQQYRTKKDVAEVKEQVKNTHESNLRVDMDETKAIASKAEKHSADAATDAALAKESAHRVERLASDLLTTLRAVEHAIDRRDQLHADAMTEIREDVDKTTAGLHQHLDDVPRILDEAFSRHVGDCPLRHDS